MNIATAPNVNTTIGIARPPVTVRRYTTRDLITVIFYYRRSMILAFVVPVLLGFMAAAVTKPAFVAQARLVVLYGGEYFYQPTAGQPGSTVALDRNEIMTSEIEVLKNTDLAKQTLLTVGLDKVYPGTKTDDPQVLQAAVGRFEADLTASSIAQSNILELSFRSHAAAVGTEVLRTLIAGYMADRGKIFQRAPAAVVVAEQDGLLTRLRAAEAALAGFAEQHGIVNLDQQTALLLQRQSGNRQARDDTAQAVSEAEAKLSVLQEQLRAMPPVIQSYADSDRSHATQVLTDSLLRLQVKRRELASRYSNSFPDIQSLDREIQWLQEQIANVPHREGTAVRDTPNPLYQDMQQQAAMLQAQIKGLQAKQGELARDADTIDQRIRSLTGTASAYRDLQRSRDVLDETYRALVRSNEATQASSGADGSRAANIRVVQPPESSNARLNLRIVLPAAGVVLGAVAAVAMMVLLNALRQVFITSRDVNLALDLPVLASVERRSRRWQRRAAAGSLAFRPGVQGA